MKNSRHGGIFLVNINNLMCVIVNLNTKTLTISNKLMKSALVDTRPQDEKIILLDCEEDLNLSRQLFSGLSQHLDEIYMREIVYSYIERFLEM